MEYICVDKGTSKCPCILMEAGQCYTCQMIKTDKCACQEQWQGVCPYTEYVQNNKEALEQLKERQFHIVDIKSYSPTLSVITIEASLGYGINCRELGAFLMIKWKECFVPISVLQVDIQFSRQVSYIKLAINATGPKTIGLLKGCLIGEKVTAKGPYYSGVINSHQYNSNALNLVVAKGIAVMPVVNVKDKIGNNLGSFKLDTSKLPDSFLEEFLGDIEYEEVNLENDLWRIIKGIKEDYNYSLECTGMAPNLFLMVSPYFKDEIIKRIVLKNERILMPNHSNICCGEGICGSCSFTDPNGTTVRKCKCIDY